MEEIKKVFCTSCGSAIEGNQTNCLNCNALIKVEKTEEEKKENKLQVKTILLYFVGYMIIGVYALAFICAIISFITILGQNPDVTDATLLIELVMNDVINKVMIGQFFLDAIFLGAFIYLCRSMLKIPNLAGKNIGIIILKVLGISVLMLLGNMIIGMLISLIPGAEDSANQEAIAQMIEIAPFTMVFSAVIFAPIVEELVFRGAIYNMIAKKTSAIKTILISGAIFGALHVVFGLVGGDLFELIYFIQYFLMGAAFGFIYHKTKSIHVCIAVHFINNLVAVLMMFLL